MPRGISKQKGAPPVETHARRRDVAWALAVAAALIGLKIACEDRPFARRLEQVAFEWQQLHLTGDSPDVPVVVDVSQVPKQPRQLPDDSTLVTDRNALIEIMSAVAQKNPAAIGIDILLNPPRPGDSLTSDERRLLDVCLTLSRAGSPVFVGIDHRGMASGRELWLGGERFAPLAVSVTVPRPDELGMTAMMVNTHTIESRDRVSVIPSMATALANGRRTTRRQFGQWLAEHSHGLVTQTVEHRDHRVTTGDFPIDFSVLGELFRTTVKAAQFSDVATSPVRIKGKVVLIGNGVGSTEDAFRAPGQADPIAGVYIHAAATHTLIAAPLFRLSPWGRVTADVLVALIPIALFQLAQNVAWLTRRRARLASILSVTAAVAVWLIAFTFIDQTGVLWTDGLIVAGSLLLHEPLQEAARSTYAGLAGLVGRTTAHDSHRHSPAGRPRKRR